MRRFLGCLATALTIFAAACSHRSNQRYSSEAHETSAGDAWHNGWREIAQGGKQLAHAGEMTLERTRDGAIRVYHKTERVAGKAGEKIEDAAIHTAVKTRLAADPNTKARDIDVDVDHNVVVLSGRVSSPDEAAEAVYVALNTHGVDEVISRLTW